jgi:CheY-like chemotaxis protein
VDRTLSEAGLVMDSAADGLDGLDRLWDRSAHYDIVVLDLVIPRINGLEVLAALRATPATRALSTGLAAV